MSWQAFSKSVPAPLPIAAVILLIGSLVVMLGWQTGSRALIQIAPGLAPMQFNTALGFLFAGLAVLACVRRSWWLLMVGVIGMAFLGGSALLEYALDIRLGLDELFANAYVQDRTRVAGRMSEPTALAFLLSAAGFLSLLLAQGRAQRWRLPVLALACAVAVITVASLLGYAFGFESIGGWFNLQGMALHTCAGFAVVSSALLRAEGALAGEPAVGDELLPARNLLIVIVIGGLATTVFVAGSSTRMQDAIQQQSVQRELDAVAEQVLLGLQSTSKLLDGAVGLYRASQRVDRDEWRKYVAALRSAGAVNEFQAMGSVLNLWPGELPAYQRELATEGFAQFGIYPVGARERYAPIHFIAPYDALNRPMLGYDLYADPVHEDALRRSAASGEMAMSAPHVQLAGAAREVAVGISLYRAMYSAGDVVPSSAGTPPRVQRWVFATLRADSLISAALTRAQSALLVRVVEASESAVTLFEDAGFDPAQQSRKTALEFGGRSWQLDAHVAPGAEAGGGYFVSLLIFLTGCAITLAVALAILFFAYTRRRAEALAERMTASLAEQQALLRQNEEHYSLALRGARDGYWDWDRGRASLFCSPGLCAMLGRQDFEVKGALDEFLAMNCSATEAARLRAALQPLLEGRESSLDLELQMSDMHGDQRWFELRGRALEPGGGRIAGSLANIHDRKLLELEMQERNVHLTHLNRELNQVSFIAAHNLKEPVRKVSVYASKLRRTLERTEQPSELTGPLEKIDRCASRMAHLVDDLMAYSQVIGEDLRPELFEFDQMIRPVLARLGRQFEPARYEVLVDDLPELRGDQAMLRKVFEELLSNAVSYGKPGQRVQIRIAYRGLVTHAGSGGLFHRIEVRDNGVGIQAEHIDRAFNLFERLQHADDSDSTGLGLAVVRKVVERHAGFMGIDSSFGEGTTVWLELPA